MMISASISVPAHTITEDTKPPKPLDTVTLAARVVEKTLKNSHYKVIGACTWEKSGFPPVPYEALAIEQYLPDLVVTVSNNPGENPWVEAGLAFENEADLKAFEAAFSEAMGIPTAFDYGSGSNQQTPMHLNDDRSRVVHVIGSPTSLYSPPEITHQPETSFGKPYYSSHADAYNDRMQISEIAYMVKHPELLIDHEIGTSLHSWGPEIPRLMHVTQPSRFRASVVTAMHAADIVTNKGFGHVRQATTNSCGPNCVVANVIFEPKSEHVIWQEVYPINRNIRPGDPNDFGIKDDKKGHGNYVFVVWRKYRGCVKQQDKYLKGLPKVGKPQKR